MSTGFDLPNQHSLTKTSRRSTLGDLLLIALAYLLIARGALVFVVYPEGMATVWFPSGLALAVLLLFPRREWAMLLATMFIANVGANLWGGNSLAVSFGFAVGNTLEPAVGAWVFTRLVGDQIKFTRLNEVLALVCIAIFSIALTALMGALVPAIAFNADYWRVWLTWWIPDALAVFLFTPFIVTWATSPFPRLPSLRRIIEVVALFASTIVASYIIFGMNVQTTTILQAYMIIPFMIWAALRFTLRGTSSAMLVTSLFAIWGTAHGLGFFAHPSGNVHESLLSTQLFLSVTTVMTLIVSVMLNERRQAEKSLRENEAHLRQMYEHLPLGYQSLDAEGRFIEVNPVWCAMLGYPREQVIGKWFGDFLVPSQVDLFRQRFPRFKQLGEIHDIEFEMVRQDGTHVFVQFDGKIGRDAHGEFKQTHCILNDITARKRIEAELQASEARYRNLFENMLGGYAYCQMIFENGRPVDFVYLEVNKAFGDLTGLHEVVGKKVTEVIPRIREESPEIFEIYGRVSQTGTPERFELDFKPLGIWLSISVYSPAPGYFVAVFDNITDRKQSEQALRESEEQFRSVVQTANDAIISEDAAGNVIFWNRAAESIFGYTADEMHGKPLSLIMPERFRDLHWQGLQDAVARGKANWNGKTLEMIGLAKDGHEFPIELSLAQWQAQRGIFFTAIIRDITARKRAEAELRESEASLKFSQQVAHLGHWTWDTQTNQLVWSDEMYRIFGIDRQNFDGALDKVIAQAIHPDDRAKVNAANTAVITEHKSEPLEYRVVWADGSVRTVWAVPGAKITDRDGKILKLSGIVQDITERNQAEEMLRASETSYRDLFNSVTEAIYVQNRDGVFLDVNRGAEIMYGYRREELIGKTPALVSAPDKNDLAQVMHAVTRAFAGEPQQFEFWGKRANGEIFPKEVRLSRGTYFGQPVVIAVAIDITERKKRERELEAIATVTAALRTAVTRDDMMPIIVEQISTLLGTESAAIGLYDLATAESVIQYANGSWAGAIGRHTPANVGVSHYVLTHKRPYVTADLANDPIFVSRDLVGDIRGMGCVPLIANDDVIGWLFAGVHTTLSDDDVRILQAIADIAASAINRATLHEQTEERLRRLGALQVIDRAINSSLDLHVTLGILINQVINQLNADAATVLLFQRQNRSLTCVAAKGFRRNGNTRANVQLNSDAISRIILERRLIQIANLNENPGALGHADRFANEGFVSYYAFPLVAKGQVKGVLEILYRTPHTPQPEWLDFGKALAEQAAIAVDNGELFAELQRRNDELIVAYDTTIEGWARALDLRDRETEGHTRRVVEHTLRLAQMMGVPADQMIHIQRGTLLHDIGKLGIPDAILLKPGKLTAEEWQTMRLHPVYAHELLSAIPYLHPAIDIPYCHHEKWDGTGYPRGLKGYEIPLAARIFAIVDVWDALRSDRPYRKAWSDQQIYEYLCEQTGKHFDPQVVDAFLKLLAINSAR